MEVPLFIWAIRRGIYRLSSNTDRADIPQNAIRLGSLAPQILLDTRLLYNVLSNSTHYENIPHVPGETAAELQALAVAKWNFRQACRPDVRKAMAQLAPLRNPEVKDAQKMSGVHGQNVHDTDA